MAYSLEFLFSLHKVLCLEGRGMCDGSSGSVAGKGSCIRTACF